MLKFQELTAAGFLNAVYNKRLASLIADRENVLDSRALSDNTNIHVSDINDVFRVVNNPRLATLRLALQIN